jgi:hypothetical protein
VSGPRNATTTNRGRTYLWRDETFDSVTTIIGGGVPKPALKAWGEKLVAETAFDKLDIWKGMTREEAVDWLKRSPFRETDRAAVQGSDIHDWAEKYVLGHAPDIDSLPLLQRPYAQGFLQFLADWEPEYEMTEATVYNREYGYAGTCDFLARIRRQQLGLVLGDYKTGKGVYGEVAMQLAAYRHAEFVGLPDGTEHPMPTVDRCAVLHLTPKGYELIPVRADQEAFEFFLYAQQIRIFCEAVSRQVLGVPLTVEKVSA